ncbi:MAG: sucrose-6-phosphate hydrolase [Firmicutes bacterium]|nr:sucrose-6-phosphate hydrolase [Bacillota bacterium]
MKKLALITIIFFTVFAFTGCVSGPDYQVLDGDFEKNDLSHWTLVSGNPTISDEIYFDGSRKYMQEGESFLTTKESTESLVIRSNHFVLSGMGYITFLLSGNSNSQNTQLSIHLSSTDELIESAYHMTYDGDLFIDNFVRIVWDLSVYLDTELYIQISDTDANYINVDGIDTFIENDYELQRYQTNVLERMGFMTDDLLMSAEYYLNLHKQYIDSDTRYSYHLMGEMGWINDPNGLVYFEDEYHVFYQHNPYASIWGPMHWGHAKSDDLIRWEYLPIAVAPIVNHAGGGAAFSGSAIEIGGDLYIMYTENWQGYQYQVISKSEDGITFEKINEGNSVINEDDLPFYANPVDFRDPKILKKGDTYYSVIGSRQINDYGQVLLFSSDNLIDWEYVGPVIQGSVNTLYTLGKMFECPDLFELDGSDVLIMSPQEIPGHRNTHGTVYVVGDMNYQTGMLENWDLSQIKEIDYGFDFYAPQTMIDSEGRRIMIAWMQSWNRSPMTGQYGWAGALTLPREIHIDSEGQLIQYPVSEIENYRENFESKVIDVLGNQDSLYTGNVIDIELSFKPVETESSGITVFADSEGNGTHIYYKEGYVYLDRTDNMGGRHPGDFYNITKAPVVLQEDGTLTLRILLDQFSVEVFINNGEQAITSTIYQSDSTDKIFLFSESETEFTLSKWDLIID